MKRKRSRNKNESETNRTKKSVPMAEGLVWGEGTVGSEKDAIVIVIVIVLCVWCEW